MTTIDDIGPAGPGDEELFAGLHRSVAGATLAAGMAEVEALGRHTRRRHRALAAGLGTSAAALVAAVAVLAPATEAGPGTASARHATMATGKRLAPGQTLDIQEAGYSLSAKGDGKVTLSISDVMDADKIQAALASIGISSRVFRVTVPANWDKAVQYCDWKTGEQLVDRDVSSVENQPLVAGRGSNAMTIDAARLPAGDVVVVEVITLKSWNDAVISGWTIFKQDPGPCIPADKSVKVE